MGVNMSVNIESLQTLPPGVAEATALIEHMDDCLHHGFTRLGPQQRDGLDAFADAFAGSPLEQKLADAVAALGRSEFVVAHFLALASARLALQGAQYDALIAQARDVFGLASPDVEERPSVSPSGAAAWLSSAQQWLMELALTGFQHLEEEAIAPFSATLHPIQGDPELTELAALLTGFVNELLAHTPANRHAALPVFRWADLWASAMIRTLQAPGEPTFRRVNGALTPLGLDRQSHANFVCAVLYGVFEDAEGAQTVRLPLVSYKVDTLAGAAIWDLFDAVATPILQALEGGKTLNIPAADLVANGDLILRAAPETGQDADPFAADLSALPVLPAALRHPVHIAEPVHLSGPSPLPLAVERLSADTEFNDKTLSGASDTIGLLRFDQGGWRLQPLCIRSQKTQVMSGQGLLKAHGKLKSKTLSILRERAGKLLREVAS